MSFSWGCGLFRAIHAARAHFVVIYQLTCAAGRMVFVMQVYDDSSHWIVPFIFLSFEYRSSRTEHGDCIHSVPNSRYMGSILLCLMTLFIETGDLVGNQASQGLGPFDPQGFPQRREGCSWGNATQIMPLPLHIVPLLFRAAMSSFGLTRVFFFLFALVSNGIRHRPRAVGLVCNSTPKALTAHMATGLTDRQQASKPTSVVLLILVYYSVPACFSAWPFNFSNPL